MTLLDGLRERGITLEADGCRLRLRGPADRLTPELRAELAAHKAEILEHLRRQLQVAAERSANTGTMAQVQAAFGAGQINQEQAEALAALAAQESHCLPEQASEERQANLFRRGPVHRCCSRLLGEDVLFVADGTEVPADNVLVVYRESELRQMAGQPPTMVRAIHLAKQALDGEVMEAE